MALTLQFLSLNALVWGLDSLEISSLPARTLARPLARTLARTPARTLARCGSK